LSKQQANANDAQRQRQQLVSPKMIRFFFFSFLFFVRRWHEKSVWNVSRRALIMMALISLHLVHSPVLVLRDVEVLLSAVFYLFCLPYLFASQKGIIIRVRIQQFLLLLAVCPRRFNANQHKEPFAMLM
jgi:hypothetical protein